MKAGLTLNHNADSEQFAIVDLPNSTTHSSPNSSNDSSPSSFRHMDSSTPQQWEVIVNETIAHQSHMADQILVFLRQLESIKTGFAINQLLHSLQTASRAEKSGTTNELILASLCHDIGKVASILNHAQISAEILRPYVSNDTYEVIGAHQDFQGKHYYRYIGQDPDLRESYRDRPWFDLAEQFADDWDQSSFDPDYPTPKLSYYEPLVREIFARPFGF